MSVQNTVVHQLLLNKSINNNNENKCKLYKGMQKSKMYNSHTHTSMQIILLPDYLKHYIMLKACKFLMMIIIINITKKKKICESRNPFQLAALSLQFVENSH